MENLIYKVECALLDKSYRDGLSNYTQANCQVTLTDNGFRIYRPPNLTTANNGNTMWGGLRLQPHYAKPGGTLFKGHTYILLFDVKGQSSNGSYGYFTNQMGWGGGGLDPKPSNIVDRGLPSNFQGSYTYYYRFTITDDVYKVCTSSYSGFTAGTTYLSYRDFAWGFQYTSTGSLGTDLYLTNFRMYDITQNPKISFDKSGNVIIGSIIEESSIKISKSTELRCSNFIEV